MAVYRSACRGTSQDPLRERPLPVPRRVFSLLRWGWVRSTPAVRQQKQFPTSFNNWGEWIWAMSQHKISITREIYSRWRREHSPPSWPRISFRREKLCPGWRIVLQQSMVGAGQLFLEHSRLSMHKEKFRKHLTKVSPWNTLRYSFFKVKINTMFGFSPLKWNFYYSNLPLDKWFSRRSLHYYIYKQLTVFKCLVILSPYVLVSIII